MRDRYPTLSVRLKRARLLAGAWLLVLAGGVFGGEAAAATPSITSISPESGDAYERVRITGTGFGSSRGTSTVTFGGTRASRYHQWRDTEIEVRPPASLAYGANAVVVTVGGQASNRVTYTRLPRLTAYCRTPGSGLSEPSGTFDIRVHRAGGTREAVTVALAYGGTATLGADYTGPATVTIAARERNGTATLRVVDDTGREGNEQITYEVSAEGYLGSSCTLTLGDDDPDGTAAPGVRISPSQLTVREGEAGSYAVVLATEPAADVTIGVAAPQGASVRVEPSSLTFTSRNWSTPQRVTVTEPEDDDAVSEDHTLTHTAASTDSNYNGVSVAGVAVRVVDDDLGRAFVRFDPNRVTINEGETGSYTVVLATQPTADVTIPVEVPLGASLAAEPSSLTFTSRNWSTPQTVTVTGLEDDDQVDSPYIMSYRSISRDREYSNAATEWSQITVIDDDGPGVRIDPEELTVREGETGSYAVVLVTQPRADVTIAVAVPEEASVRVEPTSLTFTSQNWSTPQTVTVTALEDDDAAGGTHSIDHLAWSRDPDYFGIFIDLISVTVVDNDPAAPGVMISPSQLTVREGEAGSYAVVLATEPAADVTIGVAAPQGVSVRVEPSSLTFTSRNWSTPQRVTVTEPEDDDAVSEDHTLTHTAASTDSNYNGVSVAGVAVRVVDDDLGRAFVRFDPNRVTINEGETGSYTVVLATQPTADVTIPVEVPLGASLAAEPSSLTFTSRNWSTPQTVTVTGLEDDDQVDSPYIMSYRSISRDREYSNAATEWSQITVIDDDGPGVRIDPEELTVREGETGSYAVVLVTQPRADVTIAVAVPEEASVRVEPTSLTFTSRNWSTPQTVTVTALEDDDEVSENHTLTHTAASTDPDYNGVSVDGVALTVVDNDTGAPGVMISPSQLTVREGEAGRYAVVLTARPTHAVTVVMEPPSDGKLSVSPESLAFSTTDWSTAQTVRVTAHEDGDKADGTMSLGHRVESADGNYQGVAAGSVQVGVTDDDELEVRVSPTRLTIAEGGEGSYTLVMVEEPPRGLTVTIGNPDGSKLRISPESVEFTSGENGNWNQPQTVTVTALQDADAVSEKLRITHEAAFVAGTVTAKEYIYIGSRLLAIEPGGGVAPQLSFDDVRVEITDDEASAAGLTVSPGRPAIAEGYTGSYTVAPNSRPTHPGTLALEVSPASLSFSRSNRHRPQGVSLPAAADGGSAAHFGATRDTVNFGAQSAAIESWGAGTIVALAPLHLPEGGARARANSRAGNGVTATGNPFHRERDEVECEALENCPEDEEEDSPPDP